MFLSLILRAVGSGARLLPCRGNLSRVAEGVLTFGHRDTQPLRGVCRRFLGLARLRFLGHLPPMVDRDGVLVAQAPTGGSPSQRGR